MTIRAKYPGCVIEFEPGPHLYTINGEPVPSVTTIVGELCPASFGVAAWYGQRIGIEGCLELLKHEINLAPLHPEEVVKLLTQERLTTNHQRSKAGSRGTSVHKAAELWATTQEWPDPVRYPDEEAGYIEALGKWILDKGPEPLAVEQIVGSAEFGFAGTLDLRCKISAKAGLVDFKTSKHIYNPAYDYQLAAYEFASGQCGLGATEFRAIVKLNPDGTFEHYESPMEPKAVIALLSCWRERRRLDDVLAERQRQLRHQLELRS